MPHSLNHLLMNLLSSSLLPQFLMNFVLVHDTFVDDFMTIAGGTVLPLRRCSCSFKEIFRYPSSTT